MQSKLKAYPVPRSRIRHSSEPHPAPSGPGQDYVAKALSVPWGGEGGRGGEGKGDLGFGLTLAHFWVTRWI